MSAEHSIEMIYLTARRAAAPALAALSLALGVHAPAAEDAAFEPQTVTEAVADLPDTSTVIEDAGTALVSGAPKTYVVQRGDTLWGIANMFLRDPWLWPEVWYVNPQVGNPHLIYPGDTLALASGAGGAQSLTITRGNAARLQPLLRSSQLDGPIATIPYASIAAFLSRPGVLSREEAESAPYVLALKDNHLVAGAGHDIYVRRLNAAAGERYNVMHVGAPLKDPEGRRKNLGHMAIFAGVAQINRPGDVSTATLTESAIEVLEGDVLMPDNAVTAQGLVPRTPSRDVAGQVMAVVNGVLLVGQYDVIAINRGSEDGLEPGHVLQINEVLRTTRDRCARINGSPTCRRGDAELPVGAVGNVLIFRTYDEMSYGLVLEEVVPINVGDHVVNP